MQPNSHDSNHHCRQNDDQMMAKLITDINQIMQLKVNSFKSILSNYPDFGSELKYSPVETRVNVTILNRFVKKFEQPDDSHTALLKDQCFDQWLAFEENHLAKQDVCNSIHHMMTKADKAVVYKAQRFISHIIGDFRISLKNAFLEIPPGETFISSKGRVSVYQKLKLKSHWTTTWNCLEDTVLLIYYHPQLKRCAKYWFKKDKGYLADLYFKHRADPNKGLAIFRTQLIENVLTIVDGSRGSSVYKDTKKRRFINVETLFAVLLQRLLANHLRKKLKIYGNDLDLGQDHHKQMISKPNYATIDKSNASDSNHFDQMYFMLDGSRGSRRFRKYIIDYRSYSTKLKSNWFVAYKTSSMGNGFTFELMTLILFGLARQLDPTARVYGDDVIIDNMVAEQYLRIIQHLGWIPNLTKTFVNSPLRESCGAFYDDDYGYITCYETKWCENISDVVTLCNKVYLLAKHTKTALKTDFEELHKEFMSVVDPSLKGPVYFDTSVLDTHVWSDRAVREHRKDTYLKGLYRSVNIEFSKVLRGLQLHVRPDGSARDNPILCVVDVPVFKPSLASNVHQAKTLKHGAVLAATLYSGMRTKDVLRNEGEWKLRKAVITACGNLFLLSDLT